ncbi:MAG: hypothetical protein ACFFA4_11145 [Promethearchaeota archaeon]
MRKLYFGIISVILGLISLLNLILIVLSTYYTGVVVGSIWLSIFLQIASIVLGIVSIIKDDSKVLGLIGLIIGVNLLRGSLVFTYFWVTILAPLWTGMG